MLDFFEQLIEEPSVGEILTVGIVSLVVGAFFIFATVICVSIERNSDVSSHSILKIILIAIGPTIVSVLAFFGLEAPTKVGLIASVICAAVVTVWNILSLGLFKGLIFSVVHIVIGFLAGMSIIAVAGIALILGIISIFGNFSGGLDNGNTALTVPEYVRNINSGETYYVTEHSGVLWLDECGVIIRPGAYDGRFIDDSGNEYIAC
ncbi:MAG: hypothetical protein ACI4F5_07885 [Acutalibacteraceae bacterium]